MKQFTLSLALVALMIGAQAQNAAWEFPNTPCAGGNTNPYPDCFGTPCTPCMKPDTNSMGPDAWRLLGLNFAASTFFNEIEVCRASNSPVDSYFQGHGLEYGTV